MQIIIDIKLAKIRACQERIALAHKVGADLESLRFTFHLEM